MFATLPDPASYSAIGWLLVSAAALAAALNQGLKLLDRWKDKPAPGDVALHSATTFATKQDCLNNHRRADEELQKIWSKIGGMERGLTTQIQEMERRINKSDEDRSKNLHDRINDILAAVSKLSGIIEQRRNQ